MTKAIEIREEPMSSLSKLAAIPIAFTVESVFDVIDHSDGRFELSERNLEASWVKDYDALHENSPADWPRQFDLTNWGLIFAFVGGRRAGGAVIAYDTPKAEMLEGRRDLAVLWDLRVDPQFRRYGLGTHLCHEVDRWARNRHCREIRLETQNINVPACRFYEAQGYRVHSIGRGAYPELPDEIRFTYSKRL
jgi:ribosomal protein S18 acetylase RimI-like enzyme